MVKGNRQTKRKISRPRRRSEQTGNRVRSFVNIRDFGFPDRYACKLKYTSTDTLSGTGSTTQKVFRLNSLFDPDLSGTGAQPLNYDQLTAVYNKYLVVAADYEVSFTNLNSTAVNVVAVASDQTLSGSTFDSLSENKRAKIKSLSINSGGRSTAIIRGHVSMSDLHGQPNIDSDPDQYSIVSANPQDVAYLTLEAADFTTATTISVGTRTKITYHCIFKEYNTASDSSKPHRPKSEESQPSPSNEVSVNVNSLMSQLCQLNELVTRLKLENKFKES